MINNYQLAELRHDDEEKTPLTIRKSDVCVEVIFSGQEWRDVVEAAQVEGLEPLDLLRSFILAGLGKI